MTTLTYTELKQAMADAGLPVSEGPNWTGADDGLYTNLFVPAVSFAAGVHPDKLNAHYGLAYSSVMPAAITAAVSGEQYSATLAGAPLTGAHGSTPVTWTLTETNKPSGATTSYLWAFGDSTTATTEVPTATHTYTAAGSFSATCTPTINGITETLVTAAAPAVLT